MNQHWEQIRRNPTPSLLTALLEDHLDPGYAAAAENRTTKHTRPARKGVLAWLTVGALLTGLTIGIAYSNTTEPGPGSDRTQAEILAGVRAASERVETLTATRDDLTADVDRRREELFTDNGAGTDILDALRHTEDAAAATEVHGPGVTVTLSDPAAKPNLSDSGQRGNPRTAVLLDRDLQAVINALWAGGAEAVALNDVRIGPGVTVRQAGGAMLVDNRPVFSPYVVSAIGSPSRLQTSFVVSDAYLRMSGVQQLYGVGFTVAEADDVTMPAAAVRDIESALEGDR
ncbi:DUF881 domain-containing protein [Rhodococcus sp. O3]|uniref:DUF881 domain-containing protein n=1 Tax=Rhodococcus sp. O3 TaxID=3404919 RepID=UPI003B67B396